MEFKVLNEFTLLSTSNLTNDLKKTLDSLLNSLRTQFVFDNLAIYKKDAGSGIIEPIYARATGRGRSKEADASWGEEIANQVINSGKVMNFIPKNKDESDRTTMPHLLGLPLTLPAGAGALVFVRFGGPEFQTEHSAWALFAASQVGRTFEYSNLQEALRQLEIARRKAQLQDDFIATISHDLNTPLGFIKGYATSLLRSDTEWDKSTQREFLTIIDEEADHLVLLIDRVLDSARLQSGNLAMDLQPVRLDSLLRDIVLRLKGRHEGLEVDLDLQAASPIKADIVRLGQVFNNLFDNAIKYAPGAAIRITLKELEKTQVVTFTDEGPGIPSEHLPYLFDRFYRATDSSHARGTGLGLFICKQIIQAHNGRISVKTVPGKGTTFRIELHAG